MTIEVFKTSVRSADHARQIIDEIQHQFVGCVANFDLDDCDHVLRVACPEAIPVQEIIRLMNANGFDAEELSDDIPEMIF